MMKIHAVKFGIAAAIVGAIVWLLGTLFILAMPGAMMGQYGHMGMMNGDHGLYQVHAYMGWAPVLAGLIVWPLSAGLAAWGTAAIYNRLLG